MAEWLEHAVAMWELSGLSPCQGGYKNLCRYRKPSDKAVKRQQFHTLNTHDTKPRQHNNTPYTLKLDLGPFQPDVASSFPPE